jgi:hypothetical protein
MGWNFSVPLNLVIISYIWGYFNVMGLYVFKAGFMVFVYKKLPSVYTDGSGVKSYLVGVSRGLWIGWPTEAD